MANRAHTYIVPVGEALIRSAAPPEFPNFPDIALSEMSRVMPFPAIVGVVSNTISKVAFARRPSQASWSDAAHVPLAAVVGRFMFRGWRRPVNSLAHEAMNKLGFAVDGHCAIASGYSRVRPEDTPARSDGQKGFKEPQRRPILDKRRPIKIVAVGPPARIMTSTHAARFLRPLASFNRAFFHAATYPKAAMAQ